MRKGKKSRGGGGKEGEKGKPVIARLIHRSNTLDYLAVAGTISLAKTKEKGEKRGGEGRKERGKVVSSLYFLICMSLPNCTRLRKKEEEKKGGKKKRKNSTQANVVKTAPTSQKRKEKGGGKEEKGERIGAVRC